MSFLNKLKQEAPAQDEHETPTNESRPAMKVVKDEGEAQVGVTEQLESIYADIDYMNQAFPDHDIRSLTDYAKDLETKNREGIKKAVESGDVQDHGIIPGEVFANLASLTQEQADHANVGIVEVDDKGVIKLYNDYEAELASLEKNSVFGRNFFTQVAPCTNNRLFLGAFKQGVQSNAIDKNFNYTFTYKMKPTPVVIQIYREPESKRNYIFVLKR